MCLIFGEEIWKRFCGNPLRGRWSDQGLSGRRILDLDLDPRKHFQEGEPLLHQQCHEHHTWNTMQISPTNSWRPNSVRRNMHYLAIFTKYHQNIWTYAPPSFTHSHFVAFVFEPISNRNMRHIADIFSKLDLVQFLSYLTLYSPFPGSPVSADLLALPEKSSSQHLKSKLGWLFFDRGAIWRQVMHRQTHLVTLLGVDGRRPGGSWGTLMLTWSRWGPCTTLGGTAIWPWWSFGGLWGWCRGPVVRGVCRGWGSVRGGRRGSVGASRETLQVTGLWLVWVSCVAGDAEGHHQFSRLCLCPQK